MFNNALLRRIWILAVLLAACAPVVNNPATPQPLPSPVGDWTLKLTKSGGFAGVLLTVEVSSDGHLTATNQRSGQSVSEALPPATLAKLTQLYPDALLAAPSAPHSGCADCFVYVLEFSSGGKLVRTQVDDTTLSGSGAAELIRYLQQLRDRALSTQP
jgi:hypothetical protein